MTPALLLTLALSGLLHFQGDWRHGSLQATRGPVPRRYYFSAESVSLPLRRSYRPPSIAYENFLINFVVLTSEK